MGPAAGPATREKVKQANRLLYDAIAGEYEAIDGRRCGALDAWLRGRLEDVRRQAPGGRLLDLGAGEGMVARAARGIFDQRLGVDLSRRILASHRGSFDLGIAAEADRLPLRGGSLDAIAAFAVLHHLYSFEGLVAEAARVLKRGGVLYCDHDMDREFHRRFRAPLALYRRIRGARRKYVRSSGGITGEIYDLAECQEAGIDAAALIRDLERAGFTVRARHHWFGLTPLTDRLFGERPMRRGWAPLVSLVAVRGSR